MKLDALLKFSKVLPLFGLLIVYGCGGGSGTTASVPSTMQPDTGTGMQPDTGTGMQPDTGTGMQPDTGTGMQPGTGTGMQPAPMEPARTAPGLGELFSSEPGRAYSTTISATVLEDYASDTAELLTDLFVKSITRNASGGYDIVYRDGSNDMTVSILPEHCGVNAGCQIPADANGRTYWFWSSTNYSNSNSLAGPGGFKFMEASGFAIYDGSTTQRRSYFLFGVETPASAVPATGEAIYAGNFSADGDRTGEPGRRARQRYYGRFRLVANFDMSRLDGEIFSIQGRAGSSSRESWPTSKFTITNGRISNGQFTADLTGIDIDSVSSVPDAESVRGFLGSIVAKFYGPNADEVGGAITATRDLQGTDNDRQLYGYIVGSKLTPRVLGPAANVAGTTRRYDQGNSVVFADDGMATVERTANGWKVTVGGRTFDFADSDYLSDPRFQYSYTFTDASGLRVFWTWTNGFSSTSRFDHFDVKGWATSEPAGNNPTVGDAVYLVHGNRTPQDAVPTSGTATYSGEMGAREYPSDQALFTTDPAVIRYSGSASMTADFAASSVAGTFSVSRKQLGLGGQYTAASGGATFNAQIDGNGLTAGDLTGTGDLAGYQNGGVRGSFFGPAAEEVGGVFDAQDTSGSRVISGYFGAKKDK